MRLIISPAQRLHQNLDNYGLFSTILGNAVFPYIAKKYHDGVYPMEASKA